MSLVHVLSFPSVVTKREKAEKYGTGKYRAWCEGCGQLKPNTEFTWHLMSPHPSSHFAMYYEPHWDCFCSNCTDKRQELFMDLDEYMRLFKETARRIEVQND